MDPRLNGLHIAILVADGFEQDPFAQAKAALEREGAITKVVAGARGKVRGTDGGTQGAGIDADMSFGEMDPEDFDGTLLPGGMDSVQQMRGLDPVQRFIQMMNSQGKPIAAICEGVSLLVSAGVADGRTLAAMPSLQDEVRRAGGDWDNAELVVDQNWISCRATNDMQAFNQRMIDTFAGRMEANLRGKPDDHAVGIASS